MMALRGIPQRLVKTISRSIPTSNYAQVFFSTETSSTKLLVKGISFSSTEKALAEAFSKFGQVVEAKIVINKAKNRPKGFAYVTFATEDEAQQALIMNGKLLDGRVIFVDRARPSKHYKSEQ